MSKFLKIMIVLLTITAVALPAFATDFSVSGQARVEGFYNNLDSDDEAQMWFDQRFRIQSVMNVSDDVKAVIRFDFAEEAWGNQGQNTHRFAFDGSSANQIDKAYLQIDKELFTLSAGQQAFGSPNSILVDHVGAGIALKFKTPVSFKLQFTKFNENGSTFDDGATDDQNFYSAEVGFSSDSYSVNAIYALLDDAATDDNRSAFGVAGKFKVAGFAIKAELDILDGDDGAGNDYTGTQFYIDANTSVSEALNVGGFFLYAAGDDDDTVIYDVTNWSSFAPHQGGYVGSSIVAGKPIAGWGTEELGSEGTITAAAYATFQASNDLGFKAMIQYATEEEDAVTDYDYYAVTASTKYKVATNTYFMADVMYEDASSDSDGDDDSISLWTQLQVNF